MKEEPLFDELHKVPVGYIVKKKAITFLELFSLKYPVGYHENARLIFFMSRFKIYATTKRNFTMNVWNGKHPSEDKSNWKVHLCKKGTRILVWMVSRFEDVGITDNLVNPVGYDLRGVNCGDLKNFEFEKVGSTKELINPVV